MRPDEPVEITDLIRTWRPDGTRSEVRVATVVARLEASGQLSAARIVRRLPARDGVLVQESADELIVRVHCELQRLAEELVQARRMREHLDRMLSTIPEGRVRIVDVGCGLGYAVRWLASHARWGDRVELVGVDLDRTLVARAEELARAESLRCAFVPGDAFAPRGVVVEPERTIMISSGLLHHLRGADLERFFAATEQLGVAGFAHWDPRPGRVAVLGAQIFHRARMREPVSRHDGVLSVRRAHDASRLLVAARRAAPSYDVECGPDARVRRLVDVMRPITGIRR